MRVFNGSKEEAPMSIHETLCDVVQGAVGGAVAKGAALRSTAARFRALSPVVMAGTVVGAAVVAANSIIDSLDPK